MSVYDFKISRIVKKNTLSTEIGKFESLIFPGGLESRSYQPYSIDSHLGFKPEFFPNLMIGSFLKFKRSKAEFFFYSYISDVVQRISISLKSIGYSIREIFEFDRDSPLYFYHKCIMPYLDDIVKFFKKESGALIPLHE